jgi:hypothetical protein
MLLVSMNNLNVQAELPYSSRYDPIPEQSFKMNRPLYGPLAFYDDDSIYPEELLQGISPLNFILVDKNENESKKIKFGTRPIYGDVSRLKSVLRDAINYETTRKIFTIVVLGGSPAAGSSCLGTLAALPEYDEYEHKSNADRSKTEVVPGVVEEGNYAWWKDQAKILRGGMYVLTPVINLLHFVPV